MQTKKKRAAEQRDRSAAGKRRRAAAAAAIQSLPPREWDRGTELVKLFAGTGLVENSRPQSLLLVSEPGTGKTEMLDRFRANRLLSYHSDMTVRQFWPILRMAKRGQKTHIVATEFQKLFMRKMSVAENMLGTLVQAMEEGVDMVAIGPDAVDYNGARVGLIGAITHGTVRKKRELLNEMGFLSRAAVFPWELPADEERDILRRISNGDVRDVQPVMLPLPAGEKIKVEIPVTVSRGLEEFAWEMRKGTALRLFNRLRSLCQSNAVLNGRDVVRKQDAEWVMAFRPYWDRQIDE